MAETVEPTESIITRHDSSAPDAARLEAFGEFDLRNRDQIRTAVLAALAAGRLKITIDFRRVTFIDAATVRVLFACYDLADAFGGSMRVINPAGGVAVVLDILDRDCLVYQPDRDSTPSSPST